MTATACYMRVSSQLQSEANGTDSQRHAIDGWLARNQVADPVWYVETGGKSGRTTRGRDAYARLLADIRAGTVGQVVAFSLSRLSRSVADAADYIRLTIDRGVVTVFVSDGFTIDPSSPFSKAMAHMAAVFAELQADIIRESCAAGVRAAIASGKAWGGAAVASGSDWLGCWRLSSLRRPSSPSYHITVAEKNLAAASGLLIAGRPRSL